MNRQHDDPRVIHDTALALPPSVPFVKPLPFDLSALREADIDPSTRIGMTGRHITASGTAATGVRDVLAFGVHLLRDLTVHDANVSGVDLSPLGLERRIVVGGHAITERVHLDDDRTYLIIEWIPTDAADSADADESHMVVTWSTGPAEPEPRTDDRARDELPPGNGPRLVWHAADARLRVDCGDPAVVIGVVASIEGGTIRVERSSSRPALLDCSFSAPVRSDRPLRLVVTATIGDDAAAEAFRSTDVEGRVRARAAVLRRRAHEHIRLHCGDASAVNAVEWAKQRVGAMGSSTLAGLAALAAGEFDVARDMIAVMARRQTKDGAINEIGRQDQGSGGRAAAGSGTADVTYEWLRFLARHLAWTGELAFAQAVWPRVGPALAHLAGSADLASGIAAPSSLRNAAESVGDTDAIRMIDALASRSRKETRSERRQPPRFPAARSVACTTDVSQAMAPLFALVDGLLGASPDAARGRLRLQPVSPTGWDTYRVAGLALGDAVVDLTYERDEGQHRFTLDQPMGAVPVRLILEPVVPGRAVFNATVDGEPASLVARPHADGLVVPVQVVLDHERTIVIETVG